MPPACDSKQPWLSLGSRSSRSASGSSWPNPRRISLWCSVGLTQRSSKPSAKGATPSVVLDAQVHEVEGPAESTERPDKDNRRVT